MKKENIYKQLREKTETDTTPALTQGELAAIFESEGNPLSQSVISKLENQQKEPPTTSPDVIKAYATHFNVTADYLLGIRDIKTVDENIAMICKVTGLSEQAVESLKKIKECADEDKTIKDDLDMLNFIMSDFAIFDRFVSDIKLYVNSSEYTRPLYYDYMKNCFSEYDTPDIFRNGRTYLSIGHNNGNVLHLGADRLIEGYAKHCILKQLEEWRIEYKDERK